MSPGILFIVSAPSGAGKTSLVEALLADDPRIQVSVSHTTRPRREGEVDGIDYHFVSREEFRRMVDEGLFLEWAEYNQNLYGTSWHSIDEPLARGRDVVLEIEVQGAAQVRERRADARFVFLLPPSMAELERLWDLLIRARRVTHALPVLETVLTGFGRHANRGTRAGQSPQKVPLRPPAGAPPARGIASV